MKVALAQFIFESNTFLSEQAELDIFRKGGTWLTDESDIRDWATPCKTYNTKPTEILSLKVVAKMGSNQARFRFGNAHRYQPDNNVPHNRLISSSTIS